MPSAACWQVARADPSPITAHWEGAAPGWAPQFGNPLLWVREHLGVHSKGGTGGAAKCRRARRDS